ncbi:MAG: DNA replication and repair protein RecF [Chloroflexota bacterium]|nr:MAG: DNA replication and repair protein RecF [Chloroflexota bacterium]
MQLKHLSLTNYRNFARLDMDLPQGPLLLVGANGQGKTSLLEAIYYLATFTSFHAVHDRELVNFLAARESLAVGRIVALFEKDNEQHRLEIRLIKETNGINGSSRLRKEILLGGMKMKIADAVGQFMAVLFLPQMVEIIEGAPEERRRFLNLAMSQVIHGINRTLADYAQTLSQRNALLKQIQEFGGDQDQLDYWDELLVSKGSQLIYGRIHTVKELERVAARNHRELTRGKSILRLSYQPAYDPLPEVPGQISLPIEDPVDRSGLSVEDIMQGFALRLKEQRSADIARGVTTVGPHRDDLRFLENGIDLGVYGSRGQVRTAMLSLKMAEMAWMKEVTNYSPVLLLDEALAELDPSRREDLLDRLTNNSQTLLTTTDLDLFTPDFVEKATLWRVSDGRVNLEP